MKKKQHPHPLKYFNDQYMKRVNELKKYQYQGEIKKPDTIQPMDSATRKSFDKMLDKKLKDLGLIYDKKTDTFTSTKQNNKKNSGTRQKFKP